MNVSMYALSMGKHVGFYMCCTYVLACLFLCKLYMRSLRTHVCINVCLLMCTHLCMCVVPMRVYVSSLYVVPICSHVWIYGCCMNVRVSMCQCITNSPNALMGYN